MLGVRAGWGRGVSECVLTGVREEMSECVCDWCEGGNVFDWCKQGIFQRGATSGRDGRDRTGLSVFLL